MSGISSQSSVIGYFVDEVLAQGKIYLSQVKKLREKPFSNLVRTLSKALPWKLGCLSDQPDLVMQAAAVGLQCKYKQSSVPVDINGTAFDTVSSEYFHV